MACAVLLGALSQAIPERVAAASSGTMNLLNIGGRDPRTGVLYNYIETYAGGQGAMHDLDGMDAIQNHMTNTRNAPVESIEVAYPLLVEKYALLPDSEGPGRFRGGVGITRVLRVVGDEVRLTLSSDRATVPPWGLFGGLDATPSKCDVVAPDGSVERLPSKVTTSVMKDHTIYTETPGGGGWGDPKERDPEAVRRDIISELVSVERARDIYGVVLDSADQSVDVEGTAALRMGG